MNNNKKNIAIEQLMKYKIQKAEHNKNKTINQSNQLITQRIKVMNRFHKLKKNETIGA